MTESSAGLLLFLALISCFSRLEVAQAQNQTTDPIEASLVNSIFVKLNVRAPTQWNISGELCTGSAVDPTDLQSVNPAIKCSCNGTVCHVTEMRLFMMDRTGNLPEELWNLTSLTILDLRQNFFHGELPPAISQLARLQTLHLRINALSGQLPKELGMLTDLRILSIGINNFSGSLPPELGSLTKLSEFYFDSSGISGVVPTSFAGLQNLTTVWGSDTQLTGTIPEFISNWSQLSVLRLQGNSFQGTIPPSFANLTSLTDLRISDVSNGNYSFEFIRSMRSLTTLVLRNNNVSGPIPSYIGEIQNLSRLDLSFNSFSGSIPDSLFNMTTLTNLFLGNNRLTGSLPQLKSQNLRNIDLSYNALFGSLPSWMNERNLFINLVGNNFTLSDANSSNLPFGLGCLQRTFPCMRGSPIYSNFSVNCGGPTLISSNGIQYDADNQLKGPSTYYTTSSRRWAVSNAGLPPAGPNAIYTYVSSSQFRNTLDTELFQSARVSVGSLRYFGLGLENGNYTVSLRFAESEILDISSWRSLGRRVFNIYVQGNLVETDFDIKKAADGQSLTVVLKQYKAQVSENYVEIHLFWAGKGTCCIRAEGSYGPLVSAVSVTPDFVPTVSDVPRTPGKKNQTGLIVGIVVPLAIASLLAVLAVFFLKRRQKRQQRPEEEEFISMDARPYTFSYAELRAATNDFNPSNKLGQGGFGAVFKGTLYDGRIVAVKVLSVASNHGKIQFMAEIETIYAVQHRNLVKLYGCCIEGDKRLLVYEYLENKSLDQALFGNRRLDLDWPTRFEICLGVARGLAYLHEESRVRIVHRDVKASNILLDSNLDPKISDFGLAKLYDDKKTHISTRVAGTIGYLAPEYAMRGRLTEKADVFGFGVVALEIVSGRENSNTSLEDEKVFLLEWAWNLHEKENDIELVDTRLVGYNTEEVKRVIAVGLLCTQTSPALRPSMSRVVAMLSGDTEVISVISRPGYLTNWRFTEEASFVSDNNDTALHYNSSVTGADTMHEDIEETLGDGR